MCHTEEFCLQSAQMKTAQININVYSRVLLRHLDVFMWVQIFFQRSADSPEHLFAFIVICQMCPRRLLNTCRHSASRRFLISSNFGPLLFVCVESCHYVVLLNQCLFSSVELVIWHINDNNWHSQIHLIKKVNIISFL